MEIQSNAVSITYDKQGSTLINNNRLSTKNKPSWCKEFYTAEEFNAKIDAEIKSNAYKKTSIVEQEMLNKMLSHGIYVKNQQIIMKLSAE